MSDYKLFGDGFDFLLKLVAGLLIIFIPLGLWKMVDIIIWLCHFIGKHWV